MSSHDVLSTALRAEGLDDEAIARVDAALAAEHLSVMVPFYVQDRLNREAAAKVRVESQAASLANAIPYAGAIKDCQASVYSGGRGATFSRCRKNARFVVRRKDDFSGHRDRPKETNDDRLAVCRVHAAGGLSHRYHGHWSYERCANEPVELEYQP
jgi:23S rRNA maturation mini-RNase III